MSKQRFTVRTSCGWVTWIAQCPPRLLITSDEPPRDEEFPRAGDACVPPLENGAMLAAGPAELIVRVGRADRLPTVEAVAGLASSAKPVGFKVSVAQAGPGNDWAALGSWIDRLLDSLRQHDTVAHVLIDLRTSRPHVSRGLTELALRHSACLQVCFVDDGLHPHESVLLAERATELADVGIRVRCELNLSAHNLEHLAESAEMWSAVTRGAGLAFVRPRASPERPLAVLDTLPVPGDVAPFLVSLYQSRRYDLWTTEPFASLLQTLVAGADALPGCGSASVISIDADGSASNCQYALRNCAELGAESCKCAWGPFCDAVCAPCRGLRRLANAPEWRRWERLFCPAVNALMPMVLEDLAIAARYQSALCSRPPDERFRVGAQAGSLRISSEKTPVAGVNRGA